MPPIWPPRRCTSEAFSRSSAPDLCRGARHAPYRHTDANAFMGGVDDGIVRLQRTGVLAAWRPTPFAYRRSVAVVRVAACRLRALALGGGDRAAPAVGIPRSVFAAAVVQAYS